MNRILFIIAFLCVTSLLASSTVFASVINVDFGPDNNSDSGVYSGVAVAPDMGTVWNDIRPGASYPALTTVAYTSAALVDSLGSVTGVTLTVQPDFFAYDEGLAQSGVNSVIAAALLHDYIFTSAANGATSFNVSIDGLIPGGIYDLYLYSHTGAQASTFIVDGVSKSVVNSAAPTAWTLGDNYQVFNGVAAASGTINVTVTGSAGPYYGVLNGLQVVPVPEPSAIALLSVAAFGLAAFSWRKR
jgi:hypothetical protein